MVKNKEYKRKLFQSKSYSKFKTIKNSNSKTDNHIKKNKDREKDELIEHVKEELESVKVEESSIDKKLGLINANEPVDVNESASNKIVDKGQETNVLPEALSLKATEAGQKTGVMKLKAPVELGNVKLVKIKLPNMNSNKREKEENVLLEDKNVIAKPEHELRDSTYEEFGIKSSITLGEGKDLVLENPPEAEMDSSIILELENGVEGNKSIYFELYGENMALEEDTHDGQDSLDYINYETPEMSISLNAGVRSVQQDGWTLGNGSSDHAEDAVLKGNESVETLEPGGISTDKSLNNAIIASRDFCESENSHLTMIAEEITSKIMLDCNSVTVDENVSTMLKDKAIAKVSEKVVNKDSSDFASTSDDESFFDTSCSLAFDDASSSVIDQETTATEDSSMSSISLVNSDELEYSPKSVEFPESEHFYIYKCMNWNEILPIINYISSLKNKAKLFDSPTGIEKEKSAQLIRTRKAKDKIIRKEALLKADTQEDYPFLNPGYLYFLKKGCNLTKRDAYFFCSENARALTDRATKNVAAILPRKRYFSDVNGTGVSVFSILDMRVKVANPSEATQKKDEGSIFLRKVKNIGSIVCPPYDSLKFEYSVFKYKDDLVSISNAMEMDSKDVILIYYLYYNNVNIEIKDDLLDMYVQDEWSMTDRILFEENFMRHSTKFNNFMMNKSGEDLRIYYKYYIKNYLPMNWTESERATFSFLFNIYKKDWNAMQKNFHNKSSDDLKVFYSSYFKKLDEKERMKEAQLCDFEGMASEHTPKKRGRKSKNKQ